MCAADGIARWLSRRKISVYSEYSNATTVRLYICSVSSKLKYIYSTYNPLQSHQQHLHISSLSSYHFFLSLFSFCISVTFPSHHRQTSWLLLSNLLSGITSKLEALFNFTSAIIFSEGHKTYFRMRYSVYSVGALAAAVRIPNSPSLYYH